MPPRLCLSAILSTALSLAATSASAQPTAECPTLECAAQLTVKSATAGQVWNDAAAIHQFKIAFVDALQRFIRAQAGTFGDEGEELGVAVSAMRDALSGWDQAIEQFNAKWTRNARDAEAYVALASVWLNRGRTQQALRALDEAERRDQTRIDISTIRALAHGSAGRADEAARALRQATALEPGHPALFYTLAAQLSDAGRTEDAANALRGFQRLLDRQHNATATERVAPFARADLLRQVAGVAPVFAQARYRSGFMALSSGDYGAAIDAFATAIGGDHLRLIPEDVRAHVVRAGTQIRAGRLDEALPVLQMALQSSPEQAEVHRILGLVYWIDEQPGKSIEHLRSAIRSAPDNERARVRLAEVLASDRRLAEAERELTQAFSAGLRSGQVLYRLAHLYQRLSDLPRAATAMRDSESHGPVIGRDRFYQEWGSLLVNQADFDGAVTAYTRRVRLNANNAEAHRQLGEVYFLQGRNDEALAEFSVARWLDPNDARAHAAAGQVYARLSRFSDAIVALQRALLLDGTLREARYALGTSLMRAGKAEEARRQLDVFSQQQAHAEANGRREFQLDAIRRQAARDLVAGEPERALTRFEEAAVLDPGSARSRRDLGLALLRAKRPADAVAHLAASQAIEETAEGHRYLIDAYTGAGRPEDAARQRALYQQFVLRERMERIRVLGGR